MAINDHISNLLARVRNAQTAKFDQLELPSTGVLENITSILKEEGFVKNYRVLPDPKQPVLRIYLRSEPESGDAIKGMKRVGRPGQTELTEKDEIPNVKSVFG